MNTFKKIISFALILALVLTFGACGKKGGGETTEAESETETTSDEREVKTRISALKDAGGLGLIKLGLDRAYGYDLKFEEKEEDIVGLLVTGKTDIASLSLTTAINLYKESNADIQILTVNSLYNYGVTAKDEKIEDIAGLKGREIYVYGQGDTGFDFTKKLLDDAGIDTSALKKVNSADEAAGLSKENPERVFILPEPIITRFAELNTDYKKFDIMNKALTDSKTEAPALMCTVARREYIENNPVIIDEFMLFYEVSVNYMNTDEFNTPVIMAEQGFLGNKETGYSLNPYFKLVFIEGDEMKTLVKSSLDLIYGEGKVQTEDGMFS